MPSIDTKDSEATLTRGDGKLPVAVRAVPRVPGGRTVWHVFTRSLRGCRPQPGDVLTVDGAAHNVTAAKLGGVGQFWVLNCDTDEE